MNEEVSWRAQLDQMRKGMKDVGGNAAAFYEGLVEQDVAPFTAALITGTTFGHWMARSGDTNGPEASE